MARQFKRLTARGVAAKTKPGRHADGGNLYLTISKTGAGVSRRWTFLYSLAGKQREAGFGPAAAARKTFGQCAAELIKSKSSEWRNEKHRAQWANTLHDYCGPIHDVPVD